MAYLTQILIFSTLSWLIWIRLHTLMAYFQQEEYDSRRFLDAILNVRLYDIRASGAVIVTLLLGVALPTILGDFILIAFLFAIGWRERNYTFKKPLVKTDRAKRVLHLSAIIMALPVTLGVLWLPALILVFQLPPIALILANHTLIPFQRRINNKFISEAQSKLARISPITIGITGSFGKTTVKHILAEILETSAPVFYSQGSINTKLGLTRHIRQRLQWGHKYFIAEMGAYGVGSVKRLCDFTHPKYGIITAVGDAHTERFGSVEFIAKAKSELAQEICQSGGIVLVNSDVLSFNVFSSLKNTYPEQVISVGDKKSCDIIISDFILQNGVWKITLKSPAGIISETKFSLPLLGAHNVVNGALAMAMALVLAPDSREAMIEASANVAQIPHRLQKRSIPGQPLILDDAYNSNELGFRNAVSVARILAEERGGRVILVTPGLAELGDRHNDVHESLAHFSREHCDFIFVVNPDRIPSFIEVIKESPKAELFPDLSAAQKHAQSISTSRDVILYENDLPDLLEKKRFL